MKKAVLNLTALMPICFLAIVTLNACKIDSITKTPVTTKHTIQVLWVGTYLSNGSSLIQFISLSLKPDVVCNTCRKLQLV